MFVRTKTSIGLQNRRALIQLHLAVVLFGTSAILGDQIHLSAVVLVWWRLLITIVSLFLFVNIVKQFYKTSWKSLLSWMGIGLIVSMHWIAFFASIKYANASVALICQATTVIFTSMFEPVFFKVRPKWNEILLAILVAPCMILVVSDLTLSVFGVWLGLVSAALLALFGILNKKMISRGDPLFITFIEMSSGCLAIGIFLLLFLPSDESFLPHGYDWLYLVFLALGCTTLGFVLVLQALKHLSAFTTLLAFNLEPVYGILLAGLLLNDASDLSFTFYIGSFLIIALVLIHAWMSNRIDQKNLGR